MQSWLVLVGTIVAFVLVGVGIFMVYPEKYTAEAQHTVEPISVLSSGSSFNTVNMETERVVATSTSVLERAVSTLEQTTIEGLRQNTAVEVPRNSQVLIFQVTANSPQLAADRANALATAYGEERTDNARSVVERTTEELGRSISKLQELLDAQTAGSSEHSATQQQLQALLDQQARITATPFYSGTLVTPAEPPGKSNRPSVLVFVAAGMFLGILIGAIAALIVSRVRNGPGSVYKRERNAATVTDVDASHPVSSGELRRDHREHSALDTSAHDDADSADDARGADHDADRRYDPGAEDDDADIDDADDDGETATALPKSALSGRAR